MERPKRAALPKKSPRSARRAFFIPCASRGEGASASMRMGRDRILANSQRLYWPGPSADLTIPFDRLKDGFLFVRIKRLDDMGAAQRGLCYSSVSALCGDTCAGLSTTSREAAGEVTWRMRKLSDHAG
jgi:hypothetical protein